MWAGPVLSRDLARGTAAAEAMGGMHCGQHGRPPPGSSHGDARGEASAWAREPLGSHWPAGSSLSLGLSSLICGRRHWPSQRRMSAGRDAALPCGRDSLSHFPRAGTGAPRAATTPAPSTRFAAAARGPLPLCSLHLFPSPSAPQSLGPGRPTPRQGGSLPGFLGCALVDGLRAAWRVVLGEGRPFLELHGASQCIAVKTPREGPAP